MISTAARGKGDGGHGDGTKILHAGFPPVAPMSATDASAALCRTMGKSPDWELRRGECST